MNNIIKFTVDEKELYLFELDGKVATIAPELLAFEGYKDVTSSWRDIKSREEFEEGFEYKTLQGDDLRDFKRILSDSQDLTLVVGNSPKTLYEQYKSVPRLDIVLEEGIFGTMYASSSNHANKFKKFMRREVNPKLNSEGSFDLVENEISKVEDETEKLLLMKIKTYEEALKLDSSDLVTVHQLNKYSNDLITYRQSKEISIMNNKIQQIEDKVNRSVVVREGDSTAEAISRKFNIFSHSNKPHPQFAEHMAKKLGFYVSPDGNVGYQDDYVTVNLLQRGGVEVPTLKYSTYAVKLISENLVEDGLFIDEVEIGKQGKNKGLFKRARVVFDTGNVWVNEVTYNLYK